MRMMEEEKDEVVLKMFLTGNGLSKFYPLFQESGGREYGDVAAADGERTWREDRPGTGPRKRLIQAI
ncbi:hypothetical protein BV898_16266 [Hypsibius exemplaris]|uniref:Uncharacterized protein n=1 Tax=Hypsibius exemplaris TaxID=2072580 RepID=A0A9X6RLB1_HYPEX|nr:hypothetical protein BV898_16266 [Hypsibius exemplaris]